MRSGEVKIPEIYDPIFFAAVLREKLADWSYDAINSEKNHRKKGRLFDEQVEHDI